MSDGVATFSGLSLDRSGRNLKLRFSLYGYDRRTGNWNEAGVHLDTDFFHVEEGMPATLTLEQVIVEAVNVIYTHAPNMYSVAELSLQAICSTASTIRPKRGCRNFFLAKTASSYRCDGRIGALDGIPVTREVRLRRISLVLSLVLYFRHQTK